MENERLPTTTELVRMLLQTFAKDKGEENFGFIIATYEKCEDGGLYLSAGCSTTQPAKNAELAKALARMFKELKRGEAGELKDVGFDPKTNEFETNQERDDRQLGWN